MSAPFAGPLGLPTYALEADGDRAEVIPSRGALCTRLRVRGEELLFLDPATLEPGKSVRGGIPVLFPMAGKLPDDAYVLEGRVFRLRQHGFARNLAWEVRAARPAELVLGLGDTDATRAQFPFRFDAELTFRLGGGRLTLGFALTNRDARTLPLHLGFHPYFRVPQGAKGEARVDTDATRAWDNVRGLEVPFGGLSLDQGEVDLHLLDHAPGGTTLERGAGRAPVRLAWSGQFHTLVVWTVGGRDFVCVEPWTAPGGALQRGEGLLPVLPGERAELSFSLGM